MPTREQMLEADHTCRWMADHLPPEQWTRKAYLELCYFGHPPEPLDAELEAEVPEMFQRWGAEVIDIGTRQPIEGKHD
jgi:hypothetical protein